MFASKNVFLAAPSGYTIGRSVRFRSSASAYFNRTPSSASSRTTWTLSLWLKRGNLTASTYWFSAGAGGSDNDFLSFTFDTSARFNCGLWNYAPLTSTQVFRDPSAWYHFVIAVDTNQATASNRMRVYVNGSEITAWTTDSRASISQGQTLSVNNTVAHNIGRSAYGANFYFDGYMTEINFINGQQLTPSSFGQTNTLTGAWDPIKYAGTYGTNGFYLNFSDNSAATATTIGKDYSGNGNNWTPNNISVTAGVTYDSMIDSPTVGPTASNYAVFNPVAATAYAATFAQGNLLVTTGNTGGNAYGSFAIPASGKWYWEITAADLGGGGGAWMIGICAYKSNETYAWSNSSSVFYYANGQKYVDGSGSAYGASYTTNAVIGIAVDVSAGTITFYKNNVSQGSITHAVAGLFPCLADGGSAAGDYFYANFGQRPFTYTPPSGFVSLNTQNLPTPTIVNGAAYMTATRYTGNGASQSITNTSNGVSFQPNFVWIKSRFSAAYSFRVFDSIRGVNVNMQTNTNLGDTSEANSLTAFNSNGFSLGSDGAGGGVNANAVAYVAWQWKAGSSSVTNTSGTITSTVNAGTTQGFSVVTYTGTGANATVGHGLGVAPGMIIVKIRSSSGQDWQVYHSALGQNYSGQLNQDYTIGNYTNYWYNGVTSSVFGINGSYPGINSNGSTYVAYCFAPVAGYSSFGSYTGNGSADGPFIYCGFRPTFILIKGSSFTSNWFIEDRVRNGYNPNAGVALRPNLANAEDAVNIYDTDILSNGFKLRTASGDSNGGGQTFIYAAFAENPFNYSRAR